MVSVRCVHSNGFQYSELIGFGEQNFSDDLESIRLNKNKSAGQEFSHHFAHNLSLLLSITQSIVTYINLAE